MFDLVSCHMVQTEHSNAHTHTHTPSTENLAVESHVHALLQSALWVAGVSFHTSKGQPRPLGVSTSNRWPWDVNLLYLACGTLGSA